MVKNRKRVNLRRTVSQDPLTVQLTSMIETGQSRKRALALPLGRLDGSRAWMGCGKCSLWDRSGWFKGLVPIPAWTPVPEHKVCVVLTVHRPFSILEDFTLTRIWRLGELINCAMAALTPKPPAIFSQGLDLAKGSEEPAVPGPFEISEALQTQRPCADSSHGAEFHPRTSQVPLMSLHPPTAIQAWGEALKGVVPQESSRKWPPPALLNGARTSCTEMSEGFAQLTGC